METKSTPQKVIDVEPEDRISCLPVHATNCILSYLPINEAVRTSLLSNKWRNKWYTLQNLVFDRHCVPQDLHHYLIMNFFKIVDHVLLLHSAPINMFKLSESEDLIVRDGADIDRWILHLSKRSIKELVLEFWYARYKIPWCLFSCQSLHNLRLERCWLNPPKTFDGFRNLKSIDLMKVTVAQDAFENLISNCPLLEELTLIEVDGLDQINIRAPNLKFCKIYGIFDDISLDNSFKLTTISIRSWVDLNSESIERSTNLLKFFEHQHHIQSLEIGGNFLKYLAAGVLPVKLPTPCIDLSYLSLRINFDDLKEISAALCLLRSSPNLHTLELYARMVKVNEPLTPATFCWEDIFSGPAMPIRVRHVRIDCNGISGTKLEFDFIKYLLIHSPVLEKMTLKSVANILELMKALIWFERASVEAEIIWEDCFNDLSVQEIWDLVTFK